jgi:predicted dehydrogenase
MIEPTTRRTFLEATATAAATSWMASPAAARPGPNETIHLGLIGCGLRGSQLLQGFLQVPEARFAAVCDVHAGRMARARETVGGAKVRAYDDYRRMLADKDIDGVVVATPGHWHALVTINACEAGKDVYVEKPLGTSVAEGRAAVLAARKYERIVQIGTQQRSWDHYHKAVDVIHSGRLGEISEVRVWDAENQYPGFGSPSDCAPPAELNWDFWVGPAPQRAYNPNRFNHHYWFFDYGGGWPLDWAVHHYDIVHWAMGVEWPVAATALGGKLAFERDSREWPDTFAGVLHYGPGPVAKRGFLLQYSFRAGGEGGQHTHAKCFYGTNGSLRLDRSGYQITAERQKGKRTIVEESVPGGGEGQAVVNHARTFLQNVRSRTKPFADVGQGHLSSNPGHLLNIAWRLGRTIRWDGANEQVLGDPEASALLSRAYRSPWKLEV